MLRVVPISLKAANAFITLHHRHHKPKTNGMRFAISVADDNGIVGIAIAANPVSRRQADGLTLEVSRSCTDGTKNVNSMLYGAVRRAAFAMGYRRLITYTMTSESGSSLKAVGWEMTGVTRAESWNQPSRPRVDKCPVEPRLRWECKAA